MTCGFSYSCWSRPSTASVVYVQRQWLQLPTQGCCRCCCFGRWRNGQRHWPATQFFLERVEEKKILRWLLHLKWRPSWQFLLKITLNRRHGPWTSDWSFDLYVSVTSGDLRFRLCVPFVSHLIFKNTKKLLRVKDAWRVCVSCEDVEAKKKILGFFNPASALELTFSLKA